MSELVTGQLATIRLLCAKARPGMLFKLISNGATYLVTKVRPRGAGVPAVEAARLKHPSRKCGMSYRVDVNLFFPGSVAVVLRTGEARVAASKIAKCVEILSNYGKEAQ